MSPRLTVTAVALFSLVYAGDVNAMCFEPSSSPPSCTQQYISDTFEDEWEFDSCKRELSRYISELEDWVICVQSEASDRAEEAVEDFNCKASGESYCF